MTVVCGYKRKVAFLRELYKQRNKPFLFFKSVILKLNIEIVFSENLRKLFGGVFGSGKISRCQKSRNFSRKASRESYKPFRILAKQFRIYAWLGIETLCISFRNKAYEITIARLVFAEQDKVIRRVSGRRHLIES